MHWPPHATPSVRGAGTAMQVPAPRCDARQVGVPGDVAIGRGAGDGGRIGEYRARRQTPSAGAGYPAGVRIHREAGDHRSFLRGK